MTTRAHTRSTRRRRKPSRLESLRTFELRIPRTRGAAILQFVGFSVVAAVLTGVLALPAMFGTGVAANATAAGIDSLSSDLTLQRFAQNSTIYAKQGDHDVAVAQFYAQNRRDVGWDDIAPVMKDSVVATEDPRFYSEGAIDVIGTARGVVSTLVGGSVQGGSSITQQLVKNVAVEKCEALTSEKAVDACYQDAAGVTVQRKVQEMRSAMALEKKNSKKDILVGYLNVVGFGGRIYGIEAASQYYFGVSAKDLSLPQAATLTAIVNNPANLRIDQPDDKDNGEANGYALTKTRRDYVLDRMAVNKKITAAERDEAKATPVTPTITPAPSGCATAAVYNAAFFCDYVRDVILTDPAYGKTSDDRWATLMRGGLQIYTTLDLDLQKVAQDSLSGRVPASRPDIDLGASNVSVEAGTGRIVTMVQNRAFNNTDQVLDGATAVNYNTDEAYGGSQGFQTGSTFKAFDLAAWLQAGHGLYDRVNASQHTFAASSFQNSCTDVSGPSWQVQNDEGSASRLSVMAATAESVNTAFVTMATKVDLCSIRDLATEMGVHPAATGDELQSLPSMTLGTNQASPLTMATAYAGIANGGVVCSPIAIDRVVNPDGTHHEVSPSSCHQAWTKDIAAGVTRALEGVMTDGTATAANPWDKTPIMGKTGTTDDALQNWLVTSTSKVAQATWVGNVSGSTSLRSLRFNGTNGGDLKLKIAKPIIAALDAKYGGDDFTEPSDSMLYGGDVTVPALAGKTPAQAQSILEGLGLTVNTAAPATGDVSKARVTGTQPGAGSTAKEGDPVSLAVR